MSEDKVYCSGCKYYNHAEHNYFDDGCDDGVYYKEECACKYAWIKLDSPIRVKYNIDCIHFERNNYESNNRHR